MWKGLIVLLGFSSFARTVEGERIAVEMCKKYRNVPIEPNFILPLPMHAKPIDVTYPVCKKAEQLIAGGQSARYGEFPHHARLGYLKSGTEHEYDFRCGGTLISERHVLTAAHCFAHGDPSIVRLGVYDIEKDDGHEVEIEDSWRHPEHKFGKVYHDIALVKLIQRVYFNSKIRPACLWDAEIRNTSQYIATGFDNDEDPSTQMIKVVLDEFPNEDCAQRYKIISRFSLGVTDGQLCIGSNFTGRGSCFGDPGSGLLTLTYPKNCMYHVVGITLTRPYGCAVGKSRALYTKVSHYLDWIEENVWGSMATNP